MTDFIYRFLICNIFISVIIGIILAVKGLLKNKLTSRTQYNIWFLLLGLLFAPFLPPSLIRFFRVLFPFRKFDPLSAAQMENNSDRITAPALPGTMDWMNDFSISVSRKVPSVIGSLLCFLWIAGILAMILFLIKSLIRLNTIKKSALPLQNPAIRELYLSCLKDMNITGNIPVYSTAYLSTPVFTGLLSPRIYLPIHLIRDCPVKDIKYMLMHELQHYRYMDALVNYIMNIACVLYWFNPFVWYALHEMENDREIACDTSVLKMLKEESYEDYGNTLINFAEKISLTPFPFSSALSGNMRQMKKRILNIATYQPVSFKKNLYSALSYLFITIFLLEFVPFLTIYYFNESDKNITCIDLKKYFGENNGSFVLYDETENAWLIYDMDYATTRIAPSSTFKIFSALLALESRVITPDRSLISWNGQNYPFGQWNADQTLESAMQNSATWYFQTLDRQIGLSDIMDYVHEIGYGNQVIDNDISSYWAHSSLKISPVEQIEMLRKFHDNQFQFLPENIEAVKNAVRLYSADGGTVYGKTGTEKVNEKNTSGWFVGYIEKNDSTYFFAVNIQNDDLATGAAAAELTFSVLSDLNLWNNPL